MVVGGTHTARMLLLLRLLLLSLTMMQLVAGRVLPAAAAPGMVSTASSTPTPHIELSTAATLSADDHEKEFATVQWKRGRHYQMLQGVPPPKRNILRRKEKGATISGTIYGHRLLLGSAPPSCQGKCGSCVPCSPIHVSFGGPHGSLTQQEYYPEAWRCKCGNRFFMP